MLSSIVIFLITILFVINAYQSSTIVTIEDDFFSVKILATENYGGPTIFSEEVEISRGASAWDVLKKVSDVTNNYGGGFVESINSIKSEYSGSGKKNDWFYYINGMLSPIGASQYIVHPGDVERWDFHDWSSDRTTTAIIADFPEPFLHGFRGSIPQISIVYSKEFLHEAYMVKNKLEDLDILSSVISFNKLLDEKKENNNLILIGKYDESLIKELYENSKELGFFIEVQDDNIQTFDETGNPENVFDYGGVIIATQNPWNPKGNWNGENVVWVVSGVTSKDVHNAVDLLVNNPDDLKNATSIVIINENIYKVP